MYSIVKSLSHRSKRATFLSVDLSILVIGLFLSFSLQRQSLSPEMILPNHWMLFLLQTFIGGVVLINLGLPATKLRAYEAQAVFKTGVVAILLILSGAALNRLVGQNVPLAVFINFGFLFFGLSVASRLIGLRVLTRIYQQGAKQTRVLIYGAGTTGIQLLAALDQAEEVEPLGFIDDNKTLHGMTVAGLPVYAPTQIAGLVAKKHIDRVLLAMPSLSPPQQMQITRRLAEIGCDIQRIPSFSQLIGTTDLAKSLEPVPASDFLGRPHLHNQMPDISEGYAGKSVLISGAGGTIGAELCRQLLACKPSHLVLFEQNELALYTIDMELQALTEGTDIRIRPILGSVCDQTRLRQTLSDHGVQVILHAAAYKHVPMVENNPVEGLRNNVLGTQILAKEAMRAHVERFVLVSTDKAVRPANVMGASKRLSELVVQDLASRSTHTLFSMVRFGNVLGSSGSIIPLFQEQIARGGPVTLTHNNMTRYFMTPNEAARLVLLAGDFSQGGDVFVLDMGPPVPIRKLARQMIERADYSLRDIDNPDGDIEIITIGLRPGEKLFEELLIGGPQQTTPHPKILRAKEESLSEIEIASMLHDLDMVIKTTDVTDAANAAITLIKRWVKEYKSSHGAEPKPANIPETMSQIP